MSFSARFYNFSKKKNSTAIPTGGTSMNIVLKEPCSIVNPTIKLTTNNPVNYNYCYINEFNRYYFITDWTSDHGLWIASCAVDVLASFRSDILNSSQYVLRSASMADNHIIDDMFIMTKETQIERQGFIFPFFDKTTYVFAISNNSPSKKINGVQYLYGDRDFANYITATVLNGQSTYWNTGSSDLTDDVCRSIINPLQYIGKAYVLPITPNQDGNVTSVDTLRLGPWTMGSINAHAFQFGTNQWLNYSNGCIYRDTRTVSVSQHVQLNSPGPGVSSPYGVYLNGYPFTERYVYAGPFGVIKLDTNLLVDMSSVESLTFELEVDFLGDAILTVKTVGTQASPSKVLARAYANVAIPITLTQSKNDLVNWLGSFGGAIGSAAQLNIGGTIAGAANAISGIDSLYNKPEVRGVQGSSITTYDPWFIQSEFHIVNGQYKNPTNIVGRPLMQVQLLNDLSGYTVCATPWVDIDCYESEHDQIVSYLTNGFYIVKD